MLKDVMAQLMELEQKCLRTPLQKLVLLRATVDYCHPL
jgi:hypothetical protein